MNAAIAEMTRTALDGSASSTDLYRLQIRLQQLATPGEIAGLRVEKRRFPPDFINWLDTMERWLREARPAIAGYEARMIGDHITLYSGKGRDRALTIAFSGKSGLLFMPTALMLQYLSVGNSDLLVVRDPGRTGFVAGMPGYAESWETLAPALKRDVDFETCREVRVFGVSGGGVIALVLGPILKAARAVVFSPHLLSVSPRYGSHPGTATLETALRSIGPQPNFACVFAGANSFDTAHAREIAKVAPMRLIPIAGVVEHNTLFPLHVRGKLAPLLKEVGLI